MPIEPTRLEFVEGSYVPRWLVAGPFREDPSALGFPGPPEEGGSVGGRRWIVCRSAAPALTTLFGRPKHHHALAAFSLHVAEERHVTIELRGDRLQSFWADGKTITERPTSVRVVLSPGWHDLAISTSFRVTTWGIRARIFGREGISPGLRLSQCSGDRQGLESMLPLATSRRWAEPGGRLVFASSATEELGIAGKLTDSWGEEYPASVFTGSDGGLAVPRDLPAGNYRFAYAARLRGAEARDSVAFRVSAGRGSDSTLLQRRREVLELFSDTRPNDGTFLSPNYLARLALGRHVETALEEIEDTCRKADELYDCSERRVADLLRVLLTPELGRRVPVPLRSRMESTIRAFPLRSIESGKDLCVGSENHRISFYALEHMIGQVWPDAAVGNIGRTGGWHSELSGRQIPAWIDKRARVGMVEWGSQNYQATNIAALLLLRDFARDGTVRELAEGMIHKLVAEWAIHSYDGVGCCPSQRVYGCDVADHTGRIGALSYLLFGRGVPRESWRGRAAVLLALGSYEPPEAVVSLADPELSFEHHERHCQTEATDATIVTHRTPHGQLSSVQEFRPYERFSHVLCWQAALPGELSVFSTSPGEPCENGAFRPDWWGGDHCLPRVVQIGGTLAALYRLPADNPLQLTHLFVPEGALLSRKGGWWILESKGDARRGLLAVYPLFDTDLRRSAPLGVCDFCELGPFSTRELATRGPRAGYVVELGPGDGETVEQFAGRTTARAPAMTAEGLSYSTAKGHLCLSWDSPATLDGKPLPSPTLMHHDGPFMRSELGTGVTEIDCGGHRLSLDLRSEWSEDTLVADVPLAAPRM